jgi:hypothetical protein
VGDAGPHAIEQVVASGIISAIQRMTESHFVSRAMALENEAAQAQQGRAVVSPMIQPAFESF